MGIAGVQSLVETNFSCRSALAFATEEPFFVVNDDWLLEILGFNVLPRIFLLVTLVGS